MTKITSIIYLAAPYSHSDPNVRLARFQRVTAAAAELLSQGIHIFSPITHSHPMADELPTSWEFWQTYDLAFLSIAKALVVLTLPGWQESVGVQAEIKYAKTQRIPVFYLSDHAYAKDFNQLARGLSVKFPFDDDEESIEASSESKKLTGEPNDQLRETVTRR